MPPLAVIFDMDGVLIDSVGLNWQAMNQVLGNDYGMQVATKDIQQYMGLTLRDQVRQLTEDYGVQIDYDSFLAATDAIKIELFAHIAPKEGVLTLLKGLQKHRIPFGVGASMIKEVAEARLHTAGILGYFEVLVTEEDVAKHKPDPDVYLIAAEQLGTHPVHCVVFEDAPSGIQAAKRAGMYCVAIRTPYVPNEKLSMADTTVASLEEVNVSKLLQLRAAT